MAEWIGFAVSIAQLVALKASDVIKGSNALFPNDFGEDLVYCLAGTKLDD